MPCTPAVYTVQRQHKIRDISTLTRSGKINKWREKKELKKGKKKKRSRLKMLDKFQTNPNYSQ